MLKRLAVPTTVLALISYLVQTYPFPFLKGNVPTHVAQWIVLPAAMLLYLGLNADFRAWLQSRFDALSPLGRVFGGGLVAFTLLTYAVWAVSTLPTPRVARRYPAIEAQSTRPPITILPLPKEPDAPPAPMEREQSGGATASDPGAEPGDPVPRPAVPAAPAGFRIVPPNL